MLNIKELIDIYENETNDDLYKINIKSTQNISKKEKLLNYAIKHDNIEFVSYILNTNNIYLTVCKLKKIMSDPKWHDIFKIALENNPILRDKIINIFSDNCYDLNMFFVDFDNYDLIDFILANVLEKKIMCVLLSAAIMANNIKLIKILCDTGYNLYPLLSKVIYRINVTAIDSEMAYGHYKKINLETYMYLEELGFDIFTDYMDVCEICCNTNSVDVFKYFIHCGINPTDVLSKLDYLGLDNILEMIKLLLENGADINILTKDDLIVLTQMSNATNIYKLLIEYGLDITKYIYDLTMITIIEKYTNLFKYFIDFIIDIHYDDDILLRCAVYMINIEIVESLLEHGANIYADNNNILIYVGKHYDDIMKKYIIGYHSRNFSDMYPMTKFLIDKGAIISNPGIIFCSLIGKIDGEIPNRELVVPVLRILLDQGIDFHNEIEVSGGKFYILFACIYFKSIELVKLCLEYGADPFIDNHNSLKYAIAFKCTDIIKLLLDLGVIFNPGWKVQTSQKIVDLLNEYQIIDHKLRISG